MEKSKTLHVQEIKTDKEIDLAVVSELLEERTELHSIDLLNWSEFQYLPEVQFRIAHHDNQIWLKYYVNEKSILAEVTETNGGVSNDSCVEFFFDPQANGNYYNFEFNCVGVTHLAYGPGRAGRTFVDPGIIEKEIKVNSTLGNRPFIEKSGNHTWEMTIIIPATSLVRDKHIRLKGLSAKANFYKCGNKTAEAHYISWNPVGTDSPDFHRPEFFGQVIFE
ncbi:carbohydrate-binding family 9-like protein [Maribacter algicola]|uniref:Carbohydrate-binding family 9-like protein n=1 Tax=Meishania litoralis TaxID=3434685 RepID=A0ACC7LIE6_9FLAO